MNKKDTVLNIHFKGLAKTFYCRVLSVGFFLLFCISTAIATNYHVSPSGSDAANGSEATPFQTIVKAASMVMPGDTVFVYEGTYIEHNITPKSSGTENAMIVFKTVPGTTGVIVKHPGTSINDDTPVFQLSNRSYIWMEGFQFKDFEFGRASIYISSGHGNVVINNRFENLGNGDVGKWNGNQMVALFNSSRNVVLNNFFDNITGDGINVNSQGSEYNLISHNTFINFKGKLRSWGGQYLYSRAIDVQDMSNGNNVIAFNKAENVIHHIWLDRDGSNNIVLRNVGRKGSGLVFNESRCAHNVIQENISMEMKVGYMTAYYETTGWTYNPRWVNNVAYNNETGFSVHKSMRDEFRNNIAFNNTAFNLKFTAEALSNAPHVFRNNLWFTSNKTNSIEFKGNAISVPEFQASIGETDGLSLNPMFVSLVAGSEDFDLQPGSPAKGAADNGLDLGAYAMYPKTAVGWNPDKQTTGVQVYFDQIISASNRGGQMLLEVRLNKAAIETISADIVPVAGDALSGEDFALSSTTVVFQPGETIKSVSVEIVGESEFDELVALRLENVTNAISGAKGLHLLRINKTLKLEVSAGIDQTVWESNSSGTAEVLLEGSITHNPFGTNVTFVWDIDGTEIATGETPTVTLPLGIHTVTLTVSDNENNSSTDEVVVTVKEVSGVWLEAECGDVGSLWNVETDEGASNGQYVTIQPGNNSANSAPNDASGLITYSFDVEESGIYTLYLRVICPDPTADSFWLRMNNGAFASWNNIGPSTSWQWLAYPNTYNLNAGTNTLTIGYREDGAKLDKLWITNSDVTPTGEGPAAGNCETTAASYELTTKVSAYPNPIGDELNLTLPGSQVSISLYNSIGQRLLHQIENASSATIDMTNFKQGIYFLKIAGQHETLVKKLIKR